MEEYFIFVPSNFFLSSFLFNLFCVLIFLLLQNSSGHLCFTFLYYILCCVCKETILFYIWAQYSMSFHFNHSSLGFGLVLFINIHFWQTINTKNERKNNQKNCKTGFRIFRKKSQENGLLAEKWQDRKSKTKRTRQKNKRGDRKGESHDSPEIPNRGGTSDIPDLPLELKYRCAETNEHWPRQRRATTYLESQSWISGCRTQCQRSRSPQRDWRCRDQTWPSAELPESADQKCTVTSPNKKGKHSKGSYSKHERTAKTFGFSCSTEDRSKFIKADNINSWSRHNSWQHFWWGGGGGGESVCVCVCACMRVHVYIHVCVCAHSCLHVCVCVCMCMCVCVCVYTCMRVCMCTHVCMFACFF